MGHPPLRPAEPIIDWARSALPGGYVTALEALIDDAEQDAEVIALLLTGSMARGDALPGTDIDVRILLRTITTPSFTRQQRADVLTEQTLTTEEFAQTKLLTNPMHVYAYLDGVALYDPDGALRRLRATAEQLLSHYRVPKPRKRELADALSHPEEKTCTAFAAGDLLKATYSLSTASWQIIEGLWAANDLPLPPNASVRPHLRDLHGPRDIEHHFAELFIGEPAARVEAGLLILALTRDTLMAAT